MQTRYVERSELRTVAALMRRVGLSSLSSPRKLMSYMSSAGRIVVTHTPDGTMRCVMFYHLIDEWHGADIPRTIYCEGVAINAGDDWTLAASSLRSFLRSLLKITRCQRAIMAVPHAETGFLSQVGEIGFLSSTDQVICECCQTMVFSYLPEHVGAVVLERIMAGNVATYGEL